MSESIRQNALFSGEDYKKVFQAYSFINYQSYDFDSLKSALLTYIQTYYPEDFNDYTESSEFIALVELIAYLGTSLAFRADLNSNENFIDTATRRESIIRLAQMVNYVPSRNIAANGLFKIASVQTDQILIDANGVALNGVAIQWNDPNNINWFDQFVQICNASFSTLNPFGQPTKSGTVGSIPTDLYQLNSQLNINVTFPTTISINGQQFPVDICNPDFITNQTIFERSPDPANAFNFIYRNDSLGIGSANTGFFLYFKQGTLYNVDSNFQFPLPNRLLPITVQNINQSDVYVQEIDTNGAVINQWQMVPALAGENVIYNSIQFAQRNIFDILSGVNDTVTIRFSDGNFGNVPTGLFRTWIRQSANQNLTIRPDNVQGVQIAIPYIGSDNQSYTLQVTFNLLNTINNSSPSETNDQIRLRAPEVFSTQSRMVNGSDYNVLPLIYGNQIAKLQSINRTYSGQDRYLDVNDPTGFHKDLVIFGEDGALFRDNKKILTSIQETPSNLAAINTIVLNAVKSVMTSQLLNNFFYDEYLAQFQSTIRVNPTIAVPDGYSLLDLTNPKTPPLFWKTSPATFINATGYFINTKSDSAAPVFLANEFPPINNPTSTYEPYGFISAGASIQFASSTFVAGVWVPDYSTLSDASTLNVVQNGIQLIINTASPLANIGPVHLGVSTYNFYQAVKIYPVFRTTLNSNELLALQTAISNGVSFWMYYDLVSDAWGISTATTSGVSDQSTLQFTYAPPIGSGANEQVYSNWAANSNSGLIYINIASSSGILSTTFDIVGRGRVYTFESYRDVRFYWQPGEVMIDTSSGLAVQDTIEIMANVNTNNNVDNNNPTASTAAPQDKFLAIPVGFDIADVFIQADGYLDPSKVIVSLQDSNSDGIPDNPEGFNQIVSPSDRIVFRYSVDAVTGYQVASPWIAKWGTNVVPTTTPLYVYFPISQFDATQLYGSPYISTQIESNPRTPTSNVQYLGLADLILINSESQLDFASTGATQTICNQISAFFNGPTADDLAAFPWLAGTQTILNKSTILSNYFFNKAFLVDPENNGPGYGLYKLLGYEASDNLSYYPTGQVVASSITTLYYDKNGKTVTQNTTVIPSEQQKFYFKWNHFAPIDQRVDPAPTNIIDMIVITAGYNTQMTIWNNSGASVDTMPTPPTTEDLRLSFQNLDQYKMATDYIVWNSGQFKLLFGQTAPLELQATFIVVKSLSTSASDNEVKTNVIASINTYFDIRNWDFGESFYFSELAAFIHQQLSQMISSVVIVPTAASSQFGNLFEITAAQNEIFMSSATVNNVTIVSGLTSQNLRI